MTRVCRSALAALGALAFAASTADAAPTKTVAAKKAPVAASKPVAQKPAAATKLRHRDRGSFNKPHPQSAWYRLGMNRRFLKTGDNWVMAWSSMTRPEIRKMSAGAAGQIAPNMKFGPATYIRYQVTKVWQHRLGTGTRTLATIRLSYASQPVRAASTLAEVTVDQFWNPVSFRVFSEDAPYGKRQDKDTRRVLHGVGEFPLYVGDLENVPGYPVRAPRVIPQLAKHQIPAGATLAIKVNNGKSVHAMTYWTPGRPYASYVVSQHHQGILVSQQLAR